MHLSGERSPASICQNLSLPICFPRTESSVCNYFHTESNVDGPARELECASTLERPHKTGTRTKYVQGGYSDFIQLEQKRIDPCGGSGSSNGDCGKRKKQESSVAAWEWVRASAFWSIDASTE